MKNEKVPLPTVLVRPEVKQAILAKAEQEESSISDVMRRALSDRFGPQTVNAQ